MALRLRFSKWIFDLFFQPGGGKIEVAICNRAGEFDRTTQSHTSTTPQSTSVLGRIEVAICDRAGELDRTAWSPTSTTQQSTSERWGGGWNGRGMALPLRFLRGVWSNFLAGGGIGKRSQI
jgi:hypothetical protein